MKNEFSPSLRVSQLASIDALLTGAQSRGLGVSDRFKTSITDAQSAATPDAHHPLFDLSQHDVEILERIRQLAAELEHETTVGELVEIRGQLVQDLSQG